MANISELRDYELMLRFAAVIREKKKGEMKYHDPHGSQAQNAILPLMRTELNVKGKVAWRAYITNRKGTSNKYHYFAVWKKGRDWIAANAAGRIGYPKSKITSLGMFDDKNDAIAAAKKKMRTKMNSRGYTPAKMSA